MMVWIDCGGSLIREHCGRIACMYVWHRKQWHHRSCFSSSCCLPYFSPQLRNCKSLHIFSAISFVSLINICQGLAACWLFVCESWKVRTLESSQLLLFFFSSPQQPMHEHYLQCVGNAIVLNQWRCGIEKVFTNKYNVHLLPISSIVHRSRT